MMKSENLTSKSLNGLKWSYASTISNAIMQIGYTAVMARLLDVNSFGLVAMGGLVLKFGSYFSQMGMSQAIIQKNELTGLDIRAAFTSSIILSTLLFIIVYFFSQFSIYIFYNNEIITIIRVMALSFIFTGIGMTSMSILRRKLLFKTIALIEITAYIISYGGIGISSAYLGYGVWSLIFASLSQALISSLLAYFSVNHDIKFFFNLNIYKPLFSFGSKATMNMGLEYLGSNLDSILIGHYLGAAKLGIYNRAYLLVNLPMYHLTNSFSRVLFPSFSRIQNDRQKLKEIYLKSVLLLGFILFPISMGVAVASKQVVMVLLGNKWNEAIPILSLLALATPFDLLGSLGSIMCDVTAKLKTKLILQIISLSILLLTFFFLFKWGLEGFAIAIVIMNILKNVFYLFVIKKILFFSYVAALKVYLLSIFNGLITSAFIYCSLNFTYLFINNIYFEFIVAILSGAFIFVILFYMKFNKELRLFLENIILNKFLIYKTLNIKLQLMFK